jgi:ubiquinone/menaquinone biosynthesis C-methylase UbiE
MTKKSIDINDYIVPIDDLKREKEDAQKFWKQYTSSYYLEKQFQTDVMINTIKKYQDEELKQGNRIKTVFEFGCHTGKNLFFIKKDIPEVSVYGADINEDAIKIGKKKFNVPMDVLGESDLQKIPDNNFDIVFTISVIDHITEPEKVCKELVRISKNYLFLIEPFFGKEGKVVLKRRPRFKWKKVDSTPFSYFWDYNRIFSELPVREISITDCPLKSVVGDYYKLYEFKKII